MFAQVVSNMTVVSVRIISYPHTLDKVDRSDELVFGHFMEEERSCGWHGVYSIG